MLGTGSFQLKSTWVGGRVQLAAADTNGSARWADFLAPISSSALPRAALASTHKACPSSSRAASRTTAESLRAQERVRRQAKLRTERERLQRQHARPADGGGGGALRVGGRAAGGAVLRGRPMTAQPARRAARPARPASAPVQRAPSPAVRVPTGSAAAAAKPERKKPMRVGVARRSEPRRRPSSAAPRTAAAAAQPDPAPVSERAPQQQLAEMGGWGEADAIEGLDDGGGISHAWLGSASEWETLPFDAAGELRPAADTAVLGGLGLETPAARERRPRRRRPASAPSRAKQKERKGAAAGSWQGAATTGAVPKSVGRIGLTGGDARNASVLSAGIAADKHARLLAKRRERARREYGTRSRLEIGQRQDGRAN